MIIKEFIILSKEVKEERIFLLNEQCRRVLKDEENAKLEFYNKLFEMSQKHLTMNEFKKDTNKLYSINKNVKSYHKSQGATYLNNLDNDIYLTSILNNNYKTVSKYFNLAYDFIKGKVYNDCVRSENWVTSLN